MHSLAEENAALGRTLASIQQRVTRQAAEQAQCIEAQQANLVRLRGELIGRDTLIGALRQDLAALEAVVARLGQRLEILAGPGVSHRIWRASGAPSSHSTPW